MYTEETKKRINWGNILRKTILVILILAIIFFIVWLINKNKSNSINVNYDNNNYNNSNSIKNNNYNDENKDNIINSDSYSEIFITNYSYYHNTAKDYFLINEIPEKGKTVRYSIQELINKNILLKVSYGDKTCDLQSSYIAIENNDGTYTMTTFLMCGSEVVKTKETLACSKLCSNGSCTPEIESILEYQYKQGYKAKETVYSCPKGYTKSGSKCLKGSSETVNPNKTVTYSCPSGYTKIGEGNNTKCSKSTTTTIDPNKTTTYSCPSGYNKTGSGSNTKCSKTTTTIVDPIVTTTYSCPSGYTKSGEGTNTQCSKNDTINATSNTTYSCSNGATPNSNHMCPVTTYSEPAIKTTTYSCSRGTLVNTKYCRIYATNNYYQSYETYKGAVYNGCTYSGSYTSACNNYSGCTKTYYKYYCSKTSYSDVPATANTTYSCSNGATPNSNHMCPVTTYSEPATKTTTYSCPSGYTKSGSGANTKCSKTIITNPTTSTTYSCPSGYTKSGSGSNTKCSKTGTSVIEPIITVNSSCNSNYNYSNSTCVGTVTTTRPADKNTTYSCAAGFTKSGSGSNTKCIKNNSTSINASKSTKTVTKYKYKWSTETSLSGWTKTGKTRKVNASSK